MSQLIASATTVTTASAPSRLVTLGTVDLSIGAACFTLGLDLGIYLERFGERGDDLIPSVSSPS